MISNSRIRLQGCMVTMIVPGCTFLQTPAMARTIRLLDPTVRLPDPTIRLQDPFGLKLEFILRTLPPQYTISRTAYLPVIFQKEQKTFNALAGDVRSLSF